MNTAKPLNRNELAALGPKPPLGRSLIALAAFMAIPLLAGSVGAALSSGDDAWYQALRKPAFTPPPIAFPIAWTLLYLLMGVSAFLLWRAGRGRWSLLTFPFAVWGLQLALNIGWSVLFFGLHRPFWALIDLMALWAAIVWMIYVFGALSRAAAALQTPYLLWVTFAGAINLFIVLLN